MKRYKKLDFNSDDITKYNISDLKRCADYFLRQYLLCQVITYSFYCPLKQKWYSHESLMEVAHFIDRQCMNTRYDLDNCHLISKQSNSWDAQIPAEGYKSKHHKDYEEWLGEDKVKQLIEKSRILKIFSREDYLEIIEKFKNG